MSNIAEMMDTAPRNLFDVFDEYGIIILITYDRLVHKFCYFVNTYEDKTDFDTRKEADRDAVKTALTLLEAKLNALEKTNEDS
jgi:crotonobetainyl-CoA:carnitine CoA-transferase CaiB-like acyl-CoA transferase